jgi:hypothetical protein
MRLRGDLAGEVEQFVRGVAHRRHHHHHVVSVVAGLDDAFGDFRDPLGALHRRSTILLDHDPHAHLLGVPSGYRAGRASIWTSPSSAETLPTLT